MGGGIRLPVAWTRRSAQRDRFLQWVCVCVGEGRSVGVGCGVASGCLVWVHVWWMVEIAGFW